MRLFIALNFTDEIKSRLLSLRENLRAQSQRGNFSLPENLHLTLAFLGECDARQTAAAKQAMTAVAFTPPEITIDRVGRFRRDGGDIWWAGVSEAPALMALQRDLTERLRAAGFALEQRRYSPHIPLGREVFTDAAPWAIEPFGETVSRVELMKSERMQGRLTYTAIFAWEG
ncbi:MAG: RNA 2',3'-cyclic phosphodiesterase [Firmicutes bacterium]|nr:RNA 2',3'-cyclic phosphodiesterase [Bacillota bacterium]